MNKTYLILGTGIAGFTAAARIRELDSTARITMIGAEREPTYLRPLLSKTDFRTFRRSQIRVVPESWYAEHGIEVLTGVTVTAMNPAAHTVTLEDGRVLSYHKCIYALGADCFVPPIPGREKRGVLTLRSTGDFHALRRMCMTAKNAVLIGGGVIGMEMAWELHQMGISCTILEAMPRLMARQLDPQSSQLLLEQIRRSGISCHTGVQIAEIAGGDTVTGVTLSDGRTFPAGLVILSTGVRAVTDLAERAGLSCDRGVVTDETLTTADPDILAAGDCIRCGSPNPGLWNYAQASGEIAGYNAVHPEAPRVFRPGSFPVILSAMGIGLFAAGDTREDEGVSTEVTMTPGGSEACSFRVNQNAAGPVNYEKRFYRDGRLVGAVLLGDISAMAEIRKIL